MIPMSTGNSTESKSTRSRGGGGKIYCLRQDRTTDFFVYDISTDVWSSLAPAPNTVGADNNNKMAWDFGDYIYVLRQRWTLDFYRYSISTDSWTSLAPSPPNPHPTPFPVPHNNIGTGLVYDGDDSLYTLPCGCREFWKYTITTDTWTTKLAPFPVGVPSGFGGAQVVVDDQDIYTIARVSSINYFMKYDIPTDSWSYIGLLPWSSPLDGATIDWDGGDTIYFMPARNSPNFYGYSISANSWTTLAPIPLASGEKPRLGAGLACDKEDKVYATIGNGKTVFFEYTVSTNSWKRLSPVPLAPYSGSSILFVPKLSIPATVDVKPETLNLNSKGNWVTVLVLDFPENEEYNVSQIITGTVMVSGIGGELRPINNGSDEDEYMCKVDRLAIEDYISVPNEEVELIVTGDVADTSFEGTCTIRAIINI